MKNDLHLTMAWKETLYLLNIICYFLLFILNSKIVIHTQICRNDPKIGLKMSIVLILKNEKQEKEELYKFIG